MDMQNRPGGRTGSGPMASAADANVERRERLKQLAMEIIDLQKDPYFMINHLGTYECKLCLTLHTNEGSYLAHTQGKKHQQNLLRRKAREGKDLNAMMHMAKQNQPKPQKHKTIKIGRPGYKVTRTVENTSKVLYFELYYEDIQPGFIPKHRVMSAFEQKIEQPDKNYQYLIFAGEPYENISFKIFFNKYLIQMQINLQTRITRLFQIINTQSRDRNLRWQISTSLGQRQKNIFPKSIIQREKKHQMNYIQIALLLNILYTIG